MFLIVVLNLIFLTEGAGQNVSVNARLDTNQILIGDQVTLVLEAFKPNLLSVDFPLIADTIIDKVEVIETSPVDTTMSGNDHILRQYYTITSFDSGEYVLPSFIFVFYQDSLKDTLATKPLWFNVNTIEIDTTKNAIADIKLPVKTPLTFKEVLPYLVWGGIIAMLILAGIYIYIKRKKKEPLIRIPAKPKEPAHITAYRELDRLKKERLWQQNKIKEYHTRVTEVIRVYIEERYNVSAMEQTSDEVLQKIVYLVDQVAYDALKQMLVLGDLVKFAKLIPLPDQNDISMKNAYLFIDKTKLAAELHIEDNIKDAELETVENTILNENLKS